MNFHADCVFLYVPGEIKSIEKTLSHTFTCTHLIRHDVPGATFAVLLRGVLVQIVGRMLLLLIRGRAAYAAVRVHGARRSQRRRTRRGQRRRCVALRRRNRGRIEGGGYDFQPIARTNTLKAKLIKTAFFINVLR